DSDRLVCLDDGLWSFPEAYCKIECPEPPTVPNAKLLVPQCDGTGHDVGTGMFTCTNGRHYNSICTLQCPHASENHTIRCTKDGEWTEEFTMCTRLNEACPPPPDVNQVQYACDEGFSVGAVCYPTCSVALHDPVVLANGTTADSIKHWMLPGGV
ncbi:unnamed protein product, partial [Coregonus sp. 'balchen']